MPHDEKKPELISGHVQQLLFSPKGSIEGLLITVGARSVQVAMDPASTDAGQLAAAVGKAIDVTGIADHSPKTRGGAHPVYQLHKIVKLAGRTVPPGGLGLPVRGVVASLHYARHGEPNGVMLDSGEFVHTRPPAMKKLKLAVGSKVVAHGELRMTVLGTPLIEARQVNRVTLD